jgi:aryl-alcohol dehydrogenase-like predicted oxidoreductase
MGGIERRTLGKTGRWVTCVGLGGEGVLRTRRRGREASMVIREACTQGIVYWDSARAYAGSEGCNGQFWKENIRDRSQIFQISKSARRDRSGALVDLMSSLSLMHTSFLDLWQIHDVRTWADIRDIEASGGALGAFIGARDKETVATIGVIGYYTPEILLHAVETWPVDTVLLSVNPVEKIIGGFLDLVIPAARKRGLGVIGMKVLGAAQFLTLSLGVTPYQLIRFALSEDIDVAIKGCATPEEVLILAEAGRSPPLPGTEKDQLQETFRSATEQLAYYRGI